MIPEVTSGCRDVILGVRLGEGLLRAMSPLGSRELTR